MRTILFLGAGASKPFGYPTTSEFLEIAEKKGLPNPFGELVQVLKAKRRILDIETVLWELEDVELTIKLLDLNGSYKKYLFREQNLLGHPDQIKNYAASIPKLRQQIQRLVYDTYWAEPKNSPREIFDELFDAIGRPIDVFSTNYDLCIENTFWGDPYEEGYLSDGFGYSSGTVQWKTGTYESSQIRLYKLHGSVNWKRDSHNRLWRSPDHDFTDFKDHVIIYPGSKGEPKGEPFEYLYSQLGLRLKRCEVCIVVGFSFRDEFINNMFLEAIKANSRLKILIWNPSPPATTFPQKNVISYPKPFENANVKEIVSQLAG
jgi:hypothetical protein